MAFIETTLVLIEWMQVALLGLIIWCFVELFMSGGGNGETHQNGHEQNGNGHGDGNLLDRINNATQHARRALGLEREGEHHAQQAEQAGEEAEENVEGAANDATRRVQVDAAIQELRRQIAETAQRLEQQIQALATGFAAAMQQNNQPAMQHITEQMVGVRHELDRLNDMYTRLIQGDQYAARLDANIVRRVDRAIAEFRSQYENLNTNISLLQQQVQLLQSTQNRDQLEHSLDERFNQLQRDVQERERAARMTADAEERSRLNMEINSFNTVMNEVRQALHQLQGQRDVRELIADLKEHITTLLQARQNILPILNLLVILDRQTRQDYNTARENTARDEEADRKMDEAEKQVSKKILTPRSPGMIRTTITRLEGHKQQLREAAQPARFFTENYLAELHDAARAVARASRISNYTKGESSIAEVRRLVTKLRVTMNALRSARSRTKYARSAQEYKNITRVYDAYRSAAAALQKAHPNLNTSDRSGSKSVWNNPNWRTHRIAQVYSPNPRRRT